MQPNERELIAGLFSRLQPFESQPRDSEAERLIADFVRRQPAAPYLMTQAVLVQEQALKAAQDRIADLEGKTAAKPAAGGFLSSAPPLGPWGTRTQQHPASAQTGGGGFLRSAMATAAGVAGGALLFEGIRNLLSHDPGPFAAQAAPLTPSDRLSSADLAQDEGAADDYDLTSDDTGFDDGGPADF
jgi:uncharacterized protein